ncbi:MAG: hypothetical protein KF892_14990 [Rhizobacter sp.]|nr:hypothetical protein [Rhizobacter sp.]
MHKLLSKSLLLCALVLGLTGAAQADTLVSPTTLKSTERGVLLNGRYFVGGQYGIHEIKRTADNSPNCRLDASTGLTVCELLSTVYGADQCDYSGMTADNTYLYAACTVADKTAAIPLLAPPKRAALFRVKPAASGSTADEVVSKAFTTPVWYNGMAVLDSNTLLMTPSAPLGTKPAIVKLKITNTLTLAHTITTWLPGSPLYLLNNGVTVNNGNVYFVGGQNLWRIPVRSDGSAGIPLPLYQTTINQTMDDLTVKGDWVVVAEIGIVNGLGLNSLTFVHKTGLGPTYKLWTGLTQLSGVVVDPGTFGTPGAFIATSYFQGGVYRYFY